MLRKYWNSQDPIMQSSALINSGLAMIKLKNDSARKLLEDGANISKENNLLENLSNAYSGLSSLDSLQGDYLGAYSYYLKYQKVIDTLYNKELRETIESLNMKNQLEKEKLEKQGFEKRVVFQDEIIKRKNFFNQALSFSIILAGITLFILLYNRRKRKALTEKVQEINKELEKNKKRIEAKNKELKSLNEMKTTLFSIISHDLKSNLGTSNQLAHLFYNQFESFSEEEKKNILKSLVNSSDSVYALTDNLLNWSRLQNENTEYPQKDFLLYSVVDKSVNVVSDMAAVKNIVIENNISNDAKICGNENIVSGVLRNLLTNAIKFTSKNGKIIISAKIKDNQYLVCVKDNGRGIPQAIADKLFDLDSNYHTLGSENENGSGFGLKLVKSMLGKIDGKIWVTSQEGVGSEFCFSVKMASDKVSINPSVGSVE